MDPVSQILSQSGAGSAQGQGFVQFAAQGAQIAQEGRRLNLMERRQQFEEQQSSMLMPLQMEAQRLNNERTGLAVQSAMKSLEQQNAVMSKMPDLIDLQTQFSAAPNGFQDPDLINRASTIFKQAPMLTETDIGKSILGGIQTAPKLDQAFKMFERMNRVTPEGTIPQSFDPQTGRMTFMAEPRAANQPANLQEALAITNLRRRIAQTTDPAMKADLEMELNDLMQAVLPAGTTTEVMGPEGQVLMRTSTGRGQQQGGMTTALQTELQKKSMAADTALSKLNEALTSIQKNPQAIGVRGIAGEIAEKAQGQLSPGATVDTSITDTRHKAGLAFAEIAKSLRVDSGNMSRYELNQLENLGDLTGWDESAQTALKKGENLKNALIGQKLRVNKSLGQPNPDSILKQIPSSEISGMVIDGLLSVEDAQRWYRINRPKQ